MENDYFDLFIKKEEEKDSICLRVFANLVDVMSVLEFTMTLYVC